MKINFYKYGQFFKIRFSQKSLVKNTILATCTLTKTVFFFFKKIAYKCTQRDTSLLAVRHLNRGPCTALVRLQSGNGFPLLIKPLGIHNWMTLTG